LKLTRAAPTLEQVVFREAPSSPERLSVNGSAKAGVDMRRPSGDGVLDMGEFKRIKIMAENDDEAGGNVWTQMSMKLELLKPNSAVTRLWQTARARFL